jgi:hypothetical protein
LPSVLIGPVDETTLCDVIASAPHRRTKNLLAILLTRQCPPETNREMSLAEAPAGQPHHEDSQSHIELAAELLGKNGLAKNVHSDCGRAVLAEASAVAARVGLALPPRRIALERSASSGDAPGG